MDTLARFAEVVSDPEPRLDEGAFLLSAASRPGVELDVDAQIGRLDDLARGCPSATLEGLRQYLFEELGFRGDTDDYASPANSYLDEVLDRRRGIPITLSVLMIEVGRRVGVPLGGVGMPGHFLVQSLDDSGLFVDPFTGGRFLGAPECADIFRTVHGPGATFREEFLDVVDGRAILWRMLNNLRQSFAARGRLVELAGVLELQLAFPGVELDERYRLAALLGASGQLRLAATTLEELAAELPAERASKALRQAGRLRARLN